VSIHRVQELARSGVHVEGAVSLNFLPEHHPQLDRRKLVEEGSQHFRALLSFLRSPQMYVHPTNRWTAGKRRPADLTDFLDLLLFVLVRSAVNIMAIINALPPTLKVVATNRFADSLSDSRSCYTVTRRTRRVSRHLQLRPQLTAPITEALLDLHMALPPHIKESEVKSVTHTLKNAFLAILKYPLRASWGVGRIKPLIGGVSLTACGAVPQCSLCRLHAAVRRRVPGPAQGRADRSGGPHASVPGPARSAPRRRRASHADGN